VQFLISTELFVLWQKSCFLSGDRKNAELCLPSEAGLQFRPRPAKLGLKTKRS